MNDSTDLFNQINNSILDLQAADLQSYTQPLKKLGRLLKHNDLKPTNSELTLGLDVDSFIKTGESSQGSMIGSANLPWPDDDKEAMGFTLLLIFRFCDDPHFMQSFGQTFYYSESSKIMDGVRSIVGQLIIPFARDYKSYVLSKGQIKARVVRTISRKIFIVHGHDVETRELVARFIEKIGFTPIILHEQANRGRTIVEKVEANADVGFAVVLLTPDDLGKAKHAETLEERARQNVLLELGYFMALLGRDRICALKRGNVEIPSDFAGVVWEPFDEAGAWKQRLAKELKAADYLVDWNAVMN